MRRACWRSRAATSPPSRPTTPATAGHCRPAGIDGVYAATDPDGRVIALLEDKGPRTKSVVVIRPATLAD